MEFLSSHSLVLVPLLPLLGALINLTLGKRLKPATAGLLGCATVAVTALLATHLVLYLAFNHLPALEQTLFVSDWLSVHETNKSLQIAAGFRLDALSSVLVLVITWIGFVIHLYALGYMEGDEKFARFFGYLNLFMGAMLILVLGDSLPITFVGWEGVGLCSYLLIGFWYQDLNNAAAGKKAFVVNRIGDFAFLLGMCLLFGFVGTLNYQGITAEAIKTHLQQPFLFGWPVGYWVALLLFIGCTGKSAQVPLYIWLPDAMAGPTPVSALIHAATMVTAGVYVIARIHPLFEVVPTSAKMLVAGIGAFTALFAATMGLVQKDLKKVLAYSTVSQLGFMFVGVGTGAYVAAVFHLVTHAFFKAGLFLGAGSVMHALQGEGDISKMGGLRKHLPITHGVFLVYCLAITGIFPFSGFFSKDAILLGAWEATFQLTPAYPPSHWVYKLVHHTYPTVLWGVLLLAALCTAIYMWRLYFLVFAGRFRGTPEQKAHLHESPPVMFIPLLVLAVGAVFAGLLGWPVSLAPHQATWTEWLAHWLQSAVPHSASTLSHQEEWLLMGVALLVSLLGLNLAYLLYGNGFSQTVQKIARSSFSLYRLVYNKYYVDEMYQFLFVRPLQRLSRFCSLVIDQWIIDKGLVSLWVSLSQGLARALRHFHNGQIHRYLTVLFIGTALLWIANPSSLLHRWELRKTADFMVQSQDSYVRLDLPSTLRTLYYRVDWETGGQTFSEPRRLLVQPSLVHRYKAPGTYHIVLEVCDSIENGHCERSDRLWFSHPHTLVIPGPEALIR